MVGAKKNQGGVIRNEEGRPYKNGSVIFSHLEDDARNRAKVSFGGKPVIDSRNIIDVKKTIPGLSPDQAERYQMARQQQEEYGNLGK